MTKRNHQPTKLRKRLVRLAQLILFLGVVFWLLIWHVAPRSIIHPTRTGISAAPPNGIEAVSFPVTETITLAAWKAVPQGKPRAAVIVLHGISDSKASQHGTLSHLARSGILAIALDLRGHGDSPGVASYGDLEKTDLSRILDALEAEYPDITVGLWGTSYGAAVALQAAAIEPRFDFLIVESTFSSLTQIAQEQVASHTHPSLKWLAPLALARAGKLGNFNPLHAAPAIAIRTISAPILHLHGEADELIPLSHGHAIRAHAPEKNYHFVSVPHAGHYTLRQTDPTSYDRETTRFLDQVIPRP